MTYRFTNEYLGWEKDDLLSLFADEAMQDVNIEVSPRSYTVNDTADQVAALGTQAIGLFSGAGGLDIGAQLAGVKVISSLDSDPDGVETMRANRYFEHTRHINNDIREIGAKDYSPVIKANNPEKLVLVGGPPCQPFSKAGYWVTHDNRMGSDDPRNMIGEYMRMVKELRPDGFLLENVESILHPKNICAVENLENEIVRAGYNFVRVRVNAVDYGVPQKRKRVFFIASRKPIEQPHKTHGDTMERLEDPTLLPYERVIDWIAEYAGPRYFEKEELLGQKTYSSDVAEVPPGKNYLSLTAKAGYANPKFIANRRFWSFLLKLHPLQPSWTIAAQPGPWVGPFHWENRRLRVPEIAAIQSFPKDYVFGGSRRSIQKQIGNAVPPLLGKAMVAHLIDNL